MQTLQIIRLVTVILQVVTAVTALILFSKLSKIVKDESEEDAPLSAKEQSQIKFFAIVVIVYFVITFVELILRIVETFM